MKIPTGLMTSPAFRWLAPKVVPAVHKVVFHVSGGRWVDTPANPMCLLVTTGARSGLRRETPLATVPLEDGRLLVVGSNFAADRHPAWTTNLLAHPEATVTFHGETYAVVARMLPEEERAERWHELVAWYPNWSEYAEATDRVFRVFELSPIVATTARTTTARTTTAVMTETSPGFRIATVEDVTTIVALVESAYRGERAAATWTSEAAFIGGRRTDAEMVRATIEDPDAIVVLALDADGAVTACCELHEPDRRGRSELGMFAVDPDRQGAGLGRRVLAEGERIAGRWGATAVELHVIHVRHELIEWYGRRGYRRNGEALAFPYGDERFGSPLREDLRFDVLVKDL